MGLQQNTANGTALRVLTIGSRTHTQGPSLGAKMFGKKNSGLGCVKWDPNTPKHCVGSCSDFGRFRVQPNHFKVWVAHVTLLVGICANCSLQKSSSKYLQMRMCYKCSKATTGANTLVDTQGGGEKKKWDTVLCAHSKTKFVLMHWKSGDMKLCIPDVHKG